jgi:hypothetical protein
MPMGKVLLFRHQMSVVPKYIPSLVRRHAISPRSLPQMGVPIFGINEVLPEELVRN